MFNPKQPENIVDIEGEDLLELPSEEDDWHEYKSSSTSDKELGKKLCKAASGFWNSGGGLFVAGVNDNGKVDGGISLNIKRQSRRDWIDQQIAKVTPTGKYTIKKIEKKDGNLQIDEGKGVFPLVTS
ncbi:MAG: ATP-binding protein [Cyanobacteria bacterium J06600_6]